MRISDNQFSQMMLHSLQSNSAGLGEALQQMSTGKRLTKLSDDPMASIKLLNLDRETSAIAQYKNNIENVKNDAIESRNPFRFDQRKLKKHARHRALGCERLSY